MVKATQRSKAMNDDLLRQLGIDLVRMTHAIERHATEVSKASERIATAIVYAAALRTQSRGADVQEGIETIHDDYIEAMSPEG
jgi:hypothetical protein